MSKSLWGMGLSLLVAAGCSDEGPTLARPFCTGSGAQLNLAVGSCTVVDPLVTGDSAVFRANTTGSQMEYVLVPFSASTTPDDSGDFLLQGASATAAPVAPTVAAMTRSPASPAEEFHLFLRRAERDRAYPVPPQPNLAPQAQPAPPEPQAAVTLTPADSGTIRSFKVCGDLKCDSVPTVRAVLMKIGRHIAIYVDSAAPQPGLTQSDLDAIRDVIDNRLYVVDTLAFGRESDIDANHVVLVLMTNRVNQLVTAAECATGGYVGGYFFGGDIDPFFRGLFNSAEIFYSIVPDPAATLSCAHSVSEIKNTLPVTFVHEFQHMISYNQHVLVRRGQAEVLWLNEGLSHYAEERGGRSYLPLPAGDSTFCFFVRGILYDAGQYLTNPEDHFLVDTSGIGGLAERGAYWLFVRYLVDHFGRTGALADADAFTRTLVQTGFTGAANVTRQTNASFTDLVSRWALANWVSDLPGFTAPSALQYRSWAFRTDFPQFNQTCSSRIPSAFPLVPAVSQASAVSLSGTLRAGSAWYYRAQQDAAAAGVVLRFTDPSGGALRSSLVGRLGVIRIQ